MSVSFFSLELECYYAILDVTRHVLALCHHGAIVNCHWQKTRTWLKYYSQSHERANKTLSVIIVDHNQALKPKTSKKEEAGLVKSNFFLNAI